MPTSASFAASADADLLDQPLVGFAQLGKLRRHRGVGLGMQPAEGVVLQLLAHRLHAHAAGKRRVDVERLLARCAGGCRASCARACACCAARSASFTSSTRMSLEMATRSLRKFSACSAFLVTRSRRRILVSPSTSVPISGPNSWSISARVIGRVLDDVVQQRRDDGRVVELQVGEDGRDLERVGEIGVAGGALLVAVRLHGVDVGAVEKRLVRLGIVAENSLDELVLPHHGPPRSLGRRHRNAKVTLLRHR